MAGGRLILLLWALLYYSCKYMGLCLYMSPDSHMKTHQTTFISLHHNRIKFRRYLFYLQTFKRCNIWCPKIVQGFWSNVTALFHVLIQHVPYLLFHFDTFLCLVRKETFFISPKMSHFIKVNLWLLWFTVQLVSH